MIIRHTLIIFAIAWWAFLLISVTSAYAYEFPPYEGLSLKIEGRISENYNNNITFAKEEKDRIEDFITMLALSLNLRYEGRTREMGLGGIINRRIRTKSSDIKYSSENINVNFLNAFSKYDRISLNNTYTHTQVPGSLEREIDISECRKLEEEFGRKEAIRLHPECKWFEEEFGRFKGEFDSYSNTFNLVYGRDISKYFNINTGYTNGQNWSAEEGTTDSHRNTIRFSVNYRHSVATNFLLSYYFTKSRFKDGGDISNQSITAGMKQYLAKRLYFIGRLGMNFTPSINSTSIETLFTGEIDEETTAHISYSKGIEISSDQEELFNSWQVNGQFSRYLLEDLHSSLSGFYGQGEFVSAGVTDTLIGAYIALTYNFWKNKRGATVKGSVGYSYSNLDSTDINRGYDRNSVNLELTASF